MPSHLEDAQQINTVMILINIIESILYFCMPILHYDSMTKDSKATIFKIFREKVFLNSYIGKMKTSDSRVNL